MILETGNPDFDGLYACARPHCWIVLEWRDGRWEHPGGGALPWPEPSGFIGWVGPLPKIEGMPMRQKVKMVPVRQWAPIQADPPAMEYDL